MLFNPTEMDIQLVQVFQQGAMWGIFSHHTFSFMNFFFRLFFIIGEYRSDTQ